MSEVGPGTILICVDASPGKSNPRRCELTKGAFYTCERVYPGIDCSRDNCGIFIHPKGSLWPWCINRFTPLGGSEIVNQGEKYDKQSKRPQRFENAPFYFEDIDG